MNNPLRVALIFSVCVAALCSPGFAATERKDLNKKDTWNLEDIYKTEQAWHKAKEKLAGQIDKISSFKGKISGSALQLLNCLELDSKYSKEFSRLYSYAHMRSDEDTRISKYIGMMQELEYLITDYRSKTSFIEPEICSISSKTIKKYISKEPGLKIYQMYLDDIQRTKAHKLSEKEEDILAQASSITDSSRSIFNIFSNQNFRFLR